MNKFGLIAAAAAAAVAISAPAAAQDEQSVLVDISDLDVGSERDAAELRRRISSAARRVCGSPERLTLAAAEHFMTCRDAAMRNARIR